MGEKHLIEKDQFFNQLYNDQFLKMWRYALVILKDPVVAEEVIQDAFIEVLLHIDYLVACEKPERWLQQTVKNKSLHVLRDRARDIRKIVSLDTENTINLVAPNVLEKIEDNERVAFEKTKQKIATVLTAEEQYLLKRFSLEKVSYKVLSEETGLSIAACQKRIQRIRKKLEKYFPNR